MSERPTESAKGWYLQARDLFNTVWAMKGRNEIDVMSFLAGLARGLRASTLGNIEMATALRATYTKLEETDKKLARIEARQGSIRP